MKVDFTGKFYNFFQKLFQHIKDSSPSIKGKTIEVKTGLGTLTLKELCKFQISTGTSIERPGEAEHGCEAEPNWSRNAHVIKRGKGDSRMLIYRDSIELRFT